jgi:hypothetical protein
LRPALVAQSAENWCGQLLENNEVAELVALRNNENEFFFLEEKSKNIGERYFNREIGQKWACPIRIEDI